jgi:hypothetical protein
MKTLFALAVLLPLFTLHAEEPVAAPSATKIARVAFAQYCFWTGEMKLGQIDGVVRTEAGYFQGQEVTLVDYDPARISLETLAARAQEAGVADRLHLLARSQSAGNSVAGVTIGAPLDRSYRTAPASDQKKQLEGTPYRRLKLTPEQATKINAFVRVDPARAREWLTAPQRAALASNR